MTMAAMIWFVVALAVVVITVVTATNVSTFRYSQYPMLDKDDPLANGYTRLRKRVGEVWQAGEKDLDQPLRRLLEQASVTDATSIVAPAVTRIAAAAQQWQNARATGDADTVRTAVAEYADAFGLLLQRIRYDMGIDGRPWLGWSRRRAVLPYRPVGSGG